VKANFQSNEKKKPDFLQKPGFLIWVDDGIPILHFLKILYIFEYQFVTGIGFFNFWRKIIDFGAELKTKFLFQR